MNVEARRPKKSASEVSGPTLAVTVFGFCVGEDGGGDRLDVEVNSWSIESEPPSAVLLKLLPLSPIRMDELPGIGK